MARVVLGALALSLVLAGCGGDPEAPPDPTATTSGVSTTPSTPPTPSAPALPEAAMANTKAGAIAFVRHYVELINHAQRTGDVEVLAAVESPKCKSCTSVRDYLSGIYAKGGSITGGRWLVRHVSAARGLGEGNWVAEVQGMFEESAVLASPGATPEQAKGGSAPTTFYLKHDGEWKVTRWTRGI